MSTELLVATLAYSRASKDTDMLARIRLVADTMRNAPGLISSRFYRGRESEPYYVMLTTWEDEECWQQAKLRYNPKQLLLGAGTELMSAAPEQWLMRYLWGYNRPSSPPLLATAHLATIRPEQAHVAQRGWIEGSHRLAVHPTLAFAFLARGIQDEAAVRAQYSTSGNAENGGNGAADGPVFLSLLSWGNEVDREALLADPNYQAILRFIATVGTVRLLPLEPM